MSRLTRSVVERHSAAALLYLRGLPRWVVAILVAAVFVGGLVAHGIASAILLVVIAGLLGWLSYLSWRQASTGARVARTAVLVALLVAAGLRLVS